MKRFWKKSIFVLIILSFVLAGAFYGCGDDDDEDDGQILYDDDDDTYNPPPDDDDDNDDDTADDDDDDDDTSDDDDDDDDDDTGDDDDDDDDDNDDDDSVGFLKSVAFDGATGSYAVAADDHANHPLRVNKSLTIEAWVKMAALPSAGTYVILSKMDMSAKEGDYAGYALFMDNLGEVYFCIGEGESNPSCANTSTGLTPAVWHHVAAVHNYSDHTLRVFWDGDNLGTASATGIIQSNIIDLWIARNTVDTGDYAPIEVDDIRITEAARSQYASNTYTVPTTAVGSDADTVAYWRFDEGSGSTVADQSTYSNDLQLNGGYTWNDH